ncbi:helix-turn-helix domain-containing protein [Streptomyces sp. NBC_01231]|nr:helix-turn-helix domain-containing protein [Streptomyces sp. NBC_01231]
MTADEVCVNLEGRLALATPADLAKYLGIPEATLAQWRYLSKGPRWIKVGRHCRYRWSEIDAWLDENAGAA